MIMCIVSRAVAFLGQVALLAAGLALFSAGQAKPETSNGVLEASELVLRDPRGSIYARLSRNDEAGALLTLCDSTGQPRLRLQVRPDGTPLVQLSDAMGNDVVELSILDELTPRILLRHGKVDRAKMFLMPDGSPLVYLKDKAGQKRVELASMDSGLNGLIIFDANEKPRSMLAAVPQFGFEGLLLLNDGGKRMIQLGLAMADQSPIVRGLPPM